MIDCSTCSVLGCQFNAIIPKENCEMYKPFKEKNMSIDEAIEELKECDSNQVAEWLEELKFIQTAKETMYREIYNQALEDFSQGLKDYVYQEKLKGNEPYWTDAIDNVKDDLKK